MKATNWLIIAYIIYFQSPIEINSQSIFNPINSSRLYGIGGQTVAMDNAEAFPGNAASLANIKYSTFSFNAENRFAGSGIIGSSIVAGLNLGSNQGLGLGAGYYGLPEYNQLNFRIGYGMALSKKIAIGTSGGIIQFNDPKREKSAFGMIQLGIQYEILQNIQAGFSYHTILRGNSTQGKLAMNVLLFGIKYSISSLVHFCSEVEKSIHSKANIKAGIEYQMIKTICLRTGITTYPQSFSTGIGLELNSRLLLDTAFSFYQSIGLSPSIGVKLNLYKPTE